MSNFGLPTCLHLLYLVNLETKRQLANIVFDLEIHTYDGSPWKFLVISRTVSLLVCDTKCDTLCKARTAFSQRIVKFSVIVMSFVGRCCSYSLNNSSKSVKNKCHWLFIPFWSACVMNVTIIAVRYLAERQIKLSPDSPGRNGLARTQFVDTNILSCWHEFWVVDLGRY